MKIVKRILAVALTLCMCITDSSLVFAAGSGGTNANYGYTNVTFGSWQNINYNYSYVSSHKGFDKDNLVNYNNYYRLVVTRDCVVLPDVKLTMGNSSAEFEPKNSNDYLYEVGFMRITKQMPASASAAKTAFLSDDFASVSGAYAEFSLYDLSTIDRDGSYDPEKIFENCIPLTAGTYYICINPYFSRFESMTSSMGSISCDFAFHQLDDSVFYDSYDGSNPSKDLAKSLTTSSTVTGMFHAGNVVDWYELNLDALGSGATVTFKSAYEEMATVFSDLLLGDDTSYVKAIGTSDDYELNWASSYYARMPFHFDIYDYSSYELYTSGDFGYSGMNGNVVNLTSPYPVTLPKGHYHIKVSHRGIFPSMLNSDRDAGSLFDLYNMSVAGGTDVSGISFKDNSHFNSDKSVFTMKVGETWDLGVNITPSSATNKSVKYGITWVCTAQDAAQGIESHGSYDSSTHLLTATSVGEGTLTVTSASNSSVSTSCKIKVVSDTPSTVAVSGLSFSLSRVSMSVSQSRTFTPIFSPTNATNQGYTLSVSDTSLASVNNKSVTVKKYSASGFDVTATSDDGGFTAVCHVSINSVSPTGITLSSTSATLKKGDTKQLTATVSPSDATNKSVTWTSNNTKVATVNDNGLVTAVGKGTATIKATSVADSSVYASCSVTVSVPVSGVSLNTTTLNVGIGETATLTATVSPSDADNLQVTWSSGSTSVATVSTSGVVTGVAAGTTVIYARSKGDNTKYAQCAVTVKNNNVPVTSVTLSKTSLSMVVGGTASLTATISPSTATDKSVTWSSTDSSVVAVSSGSLTAKKAGTAVISAKSSNGKEGKCTVTVSNPTVAVTGVSLNKTSLTLTEGGTSSLTATVSPSNATNKSVTFSSSTPSVATVSSSGLVTAVKAGSATITATTTDGNYKANCKVTVNPLTVAVTGVTLNKTTSVMTIGGTDKLTATVSPSNATDKGVIWSTSNSSVVSVSDGTLTARGKGTAVVTVTSHADSTKSAKCNVTVNDISVTGVALSKTSVPLGVGETTALSVTVSPSNATDKSFYFTTSNSAIASVTNAGKITANKEGGAIISVHTTDGDFTADCAVTVTAKASPSTGVAVTGVVISPSNLKLGVGETKTLTVQLAPSTATNKTVMWSSSNSAVASVDNKGLVTALKEGFANINVTTEDGGYVDRCRVTVTSSSVAATGVTLDKASLTLNVAGSSILHATVSPSGATNKSVLWSSSVPAVAKVDDSGKVTGLKAGSTVITVTTADGGYTAKCSVTVKEPKSYDFYSAKFANSSDLKIQVLNVAIALNWFVSVDYPEQGMDPGPEPKFYVESSDDDVVSVVDNSVIAGKNGNAQLFIKDTTGHVYDTLNVIVDAVPLPRQHDVHLTITGGFISSDPTMGIVAYSCDYGPYTIPTFEEVLGNFAEPDPNYVFVGWNTRSDGQGTMYYPGDVYTDDASLYLYSVHKLASTPSVTTTVDSVKILIDSAEFDVGETVSVSAECELSGDKNAKVYYEWTNLNPELMTFDSSALTLKGLVAGFARIKVHAYTDTDTKGKTSILNVYVGAQSAPVKVSSVVVSPSRMDMSYGDAFDVSVSYVLSNGKTVGGTVVFASENQSIATVDGSGHVLATGLGETYVIATVTASGDAKGITKKIPVFVKGSSVPVENEYVITGVKDMPYAFGDAVTLPDVKVYYDSALLKSGVDYKLTYSDNRAVGVATVKAILKGNYSGTVSAKFNILPVDISSTLHTYVVPMSYKYTGSAIKVKPVAKYDDRSLTLNRDYSLSYEDSSHKAIDAIVEPGQYYAVLTGIGNYAGVYKASVIVASDTEAMMSQTIFRLKTKSKPYTGKPVTLSSGSDYTLFYSYKASNFEVPSSCYSVSYRDNVEVGRATVIFTGNGSSYQGVRFVGSITATFSITGTSIDSAKKTSSFVPSFSFTGSEVTQPSGIISVGGRVLREGEDYTTSYSRNVNVGTASVVCTGTGAYTGSCKFTYKITKVNISNASVSIPSPVAYQKPSVKPAVSVVYRGQKLTEGVDYTCAYKNNSKIGQASVTITGKGNFQKSTVGWFTISKASIADCSITVDNVKFTRSKSGWKAKPVVIDMVTGKTLSLNNDYTLSYSYYGDSNSKYPEAGLYVGVTVTGMKNYSGSRTVYYMVQNKVISISKAKISLSASGISKAVYDPFATSFNVSDSDLSVVLNGETLVCGVDYDITRVVYNKSKKQVTVYLDGIAEYSGTRTFTFNLAKH